LTTPVATAYLIDRVIPNHDLGLLIQLGVVLVVLGATAFSLTYVGTLAYSRAESRIGRTLQSGLIDRVLRLPMGFFQDYSTGDLATRLLAMTQVQMLISTASVNAILSGVFGVFSLLLMFAYDTRLALWAGLLTLVYVALSLLLAMLRLRRERPLAQITGRVNNRILQLILGVAKIRLAAAEDRAFARWARLFAQGRSEQLATLRLGAWQGALNQVLALAGLLLFVLLIGKPSERLDPIAVGAFSALLVAYQGFAVSLSNLLLTVTQLLAVRPQLERVRPLLAAQPEAIAGDKPDPGPLSGAIEISHLRFRYESDGPLILDDVSLAIAPGDFVALVGPSGSGKSTLIRLLLGFETPEAGGILFDGQSLASIDATAVRRQMGVVIQRSELMPRSLFENIVGTTGATLDDAWEAAEQVGLAEDIRQMPMGMQTVILEGGGALSGGQMQRLMIARAIVSRPKILLLDEATSALDNRTQAIVTESLDRLRVTRLVVAHRLSTVVNADRIYVLDGGRIVETRRAAGIGGWLYADLMAANGPFQSARLAERQRI
jgi:NHLM bacteriocin system ABC transporter ATP-binding protein